MMNIYQGDDAPCKGCVYRSSECHSECDEYMEYQQKREKARADRKKTQEIAEVQYFASMRRRRARSRK